MKKKKRLKDPKGGLTAAGRAHFKKKEGANLKPGVKGAAHTPEKMRRKGTSYAMRCEIDDIEVPAGAMMVWEEK